MITYTVKYVKSGGDITKDIRAEGINNLRKRLAAEASDYYTIRVYAYNGKRPVPYKYLGQVLYENNGTLCWMNAKGNKYRLSSKTGATLDYDKYWRFV